MPEIVINNFSPGLISQPADTDLPDGAALVAQNVDLEDPGKLKNQKGNLLDIAGPTGITILSAKKVLFKRPTEQEVRMVYGTDGSGRDTLWWRPHLTVQTPAWVDAWQEITEFEGPYTASNIAAGASGDTDPNDIFDLSSLDSTTDDFYNGWSVLNTTRQWTQIVTNYVGSTRRLQLKGNITSQAVGDQYFLYRHSIVKSLEGNYTTDVGSNTTGLVDTELKSELDDFYVGWTVQNVTRGASAVVTNYDSQSKKLVHPTIAGQTSGDTYHIYKSTHDIGVQSGTVARFFQLEDAVEISVGNGDSYPKVAPLWFGYIDREYFADTVVGLGTNTLFNNFFLCQNVVTKPDTSIIDLTDGGAGTLRDDTWYVKVSFVYDGYQEGPLSESVSRDPAGTTSLDIDIDIPFFYSNGTDGSGLHEALLNKRITHIRIYVAEGDFGNDKDDYFLIREIPIDIKSSIAKNGANYWTEAAGLFANLDDMELTNVIFDGTGSEDFGKKVAPMAKSTRWDFNQGHKSKRVDANFKFRATLQEQHYKAPVFTDIQRDTFIQYSVQSNGQGVPVDDVMPIGNFINLSQKGITNITGIVSIGGFLIIVTPRRLFRYAPEQQLLEFPVERGGIAENGFVEVDDILYFTAIEDFYAFDGRSAPKRLMFGRILDKWRTITDANKKLVITEYNKKTNSVWILAGGTIFIYDIDFNRWRTHSTSLSITGFFRGINDELFAFTTSDIYEMESDTFTEAITFNWQSKVFSFAKEVGGRFLPAKAAIKRMVMKYTSDRQITAELFDPSLSTLPLRKVTFFPQTLSKDVARETNFETSQLKLSLTDIDDSEVQPETAIDYIKIEYDVLTP